jgi:hypothetical protein
MSRSGPLSKTEEFYLDSKYKDMTIEQLCRDLDRGKKQITKYVEEVAKLNNPPHIANSLSMMGKKDGAVVMTQAAEEMAEEVLKNRPDSRASSRYKTRVFRPNEAAKND